MARSLTMLGIDLTVGKEVGQSSESPQGLANGARVHSVR